MHRAGDVAYLELDQSRAGRVGAAGFVAMGIRTIDQRLIGEIEFRSSVDNGAAGDLVPLLVPDAEGS